MDKQSQSIFELIRLIPIRREPPISDAEADALYGLWMSAEPGSSVVASSLGDKSIRSLLAKGYVRQAGSNLEITEKGRQIIVEMVTHAPNALDKGGKMPSYRDIKAKVARSGKQTFTKRANSEGRKVYNHCRKSK